MTINTVPISSRNMPWQGVATATGGYTLPQHAFIPHPALQQLSTGTVLSPTPGGMATSQLAATAASQRPYPAPITSGAFAVRQAHFKGLPNANA